jgi:trigger factor
VKTTLSEREGNTVKLEIEVSGEELQEAFDTKLKKLVREVRIPGFRQGKAPAEMVRQRFGDETIIVDAVEDAMSDWFVAAVAELELSPVERPKIEIGEELPVLGEPLAFTASVTVMPEVVLGEYKGLEVPKDSVEVKDEEVDAQVERMRNQSAEFKPVIDRPVRTGDYVAADFKATLEGEPVESLGASNYAFEVGKGSLFAEIELGTLGLSIDEERTFPLPLPEDFDAVAGGKTVDFTVKVNEIKEKALPNPNDTWASEVSEFATMLELKQDVRRRIADMKTFGVEQRFRAEAAEKAADNVELELPEVVIREQAQEMVGDFAQSLAQQGIDVRMYFESSGLTLEQMLEDFRPHAIRNVKTGLVLDAVAEAEGLEVTETDIDEAVSQMAMAAGASTEALKASLLKDDRIEAVKVQLLRDKASELIASQAIPVERPLEEVEPEGATAEADAATDAEATDAAESAETQSEAADAPEVDAPEAADESEVAAEEEA